MSITAVPSTEMLLKGTYKTFPKNIVFKDVENFLIKLGTAYQKKVDAMLYSTVSLTSLLQELSYRAYVNKNTNY